jgi:hypothetical protein
MILFCILENLFFVTFPEKIPLAKNSSEILQRNNSLCADGRGETQ